MKDVRQDPLTDLAWRWEGDEGQTVRLSFEIDAPGQTVLLPDMIPAVRRVPAEWWAVWRECPSVG